MKTQHINMTVSARNSTPYHAYDCRDEGTKYNL